MDTEDEVVRGDRDTATATGSPDAARASEGASIARAAVPAKGEE